MKIVTSTLDQIAGLDVLSSTIMILLFLLFIWIVFRIYYANKKDVEKWSKLPFNENNSIDKSNTNNYLE